MEALVFAWVAPNHVALGNFQVFAKRMFHKEPPTLRKEIVSAQKCPEKSHRENQNETTEYYIVL